MSANATLVTTGSIYFTNGIPVTFTVRAEDGSLCDYAVTVSLASADALTSKDDIKVFAENNRVIIDTPQANEYAIITLAGQLIERSQKDYGRIQSATVLRKGVYLVLIENNTYKVIVK